MSIANTIVTCISNYRHGFGLELRFTDHFNTRFMTKLNYITIPHLHILEITKLHTKCFSPAVSSLVV
jgi:hypothetical protein